MCGRIDEEISRAHRKGAGIMPRPRKDGERISLYLDRSIMEDLRAYADEKGQTLTTAIERIIKAHLDQEHGNNQ